MIWIYLATAVFGCAFVVPMVLGGAAGDFDGDFGGDVELAGGVDVDVDGVELDGTAAGDIGQGFAGDALGAIFSSLLSFRTVAFFSAFFGVAGLVFGAFGYSPVVTAASAALIGCFAALATSALFGLVKNSQADSQISDRTLEGRQAVVVLPVGEGQKGRVRIDLSGQPQYMVASPIEGDSEKFDVGASVVVVKVEDGTAHVMSIAELDMNEES